MPPTARQNDAPAPTDSRTGAVTRVPMFEEQKRSFLRVVSHELRTPLNSILGFSEILASELYGPLGAVQYRQYAEIIRSSGEKLLKLVNQVVEIARLQSGDIEFELQAEPLAPIFETLGEGLDETLAARGLRLRLDPCLVSEVIADSRALRNVLANLIQNALAFSPDGGLITVSAHAVEAGLEIVVTNEGDGVDPADLPRLLHPFEQGQNALTRHGEGAGLGLAICDLTCQAMGGRLELVSARGEGFSAHIVLPVA
jgi:signal transduction histidine kinase